MTENIRLTSNRVEEFASLLWTLGRGQNPFFVLGAGASAGLVPTTAQMRNRVKIRYIGKYGYPVGPWDRTALHDRIIGDRLLSMDDYWFRSIPIGALEFLVHHELDAGYIATAPKQYAVFDRLPSGTIFTFNLDGLAPRWIKRHKVLEPHGRVDTYWLRPADYEFWMEAASMWDLRPPSITPKLLPSPEPHSILKSAPYVDAEALIAGASAIIFIGYSFGSFRGKLDDEASWHYFIEQLRRHPKPVYVLSPHPEEIADRIAQDISSLHVFGVPVYWQCLASTMLQCLSSPSSPALEPPRFSDGVRAFLYGYDRAVDRQ